METHVLARYVCGGHIGVTIVSLGWSIACRVGRTQPMPVCPFWFRKVGGTFVHHVAVWDERVIQLLHKIFPCPCEDNGEMTETE